MCQLSDRICENMSSYTFFQIFLFNMFLIFFIKQDTSDLQSTFHCKDTTIYIQLFCEAVVVKVRLPVVVAIFRVPVDVT